MKLSIKKEYFINVYQETIISSLKEQTSNQKHTKKQLIKLIKSTIKQLSINKKDYKNIENFITKELLSKKYSINATQVETILSILSNNKENIKIEYKTQDSDPAIYYYLNDNLYLINYDSIDDKWYLSLIEKNSLALIDEIYSNSYENFIDYLKNKSH